MNIRRCLLFSYRILLNFYPYAFRERFASDMMQMAAEAAPADWPLILGDTGLAIVRTWLHPAHPASVGATGQDAYVAIGGSPLSAPRLIQGLALALVLILGLSYAGSLGVVELPKCHAAASEGIS